MEQAPPLAVRVRVAKMHVSTLACPTLGAGAVRALLLFASCHPAPSCCLGCPSHPQVRHQVMLTLVLHLPAGWRMR